LHVGVVGVAEAIIALVVFLSGIPVLERLDDHGNGVVELIVVVLFILISVITIRSVRGIFREVVVLSLTAV
jgi:hypothetical protein